MSKEKEVVIEVGPSKFEKTCIAIVTVCSVAVTGLVFYDRFR